MKSFQLNKRIIDFRPLFVIAVYFSLGILVGYETIKDNPLLLALCILSILATIYTFINTKSIAIILLIIISFSCGILAIELETDFKVVPTNECNLSGRVIELNHYEYSSYYVLEDCTIDNDIKVKHKISLSCKDHNLEYGDVIDLDAKISYLKSASNINGFDIKKYYVSKGIGYKAKSSQDKVTVLYNKIKLDTYLYKAKQYFSENIDSLYSEKTYGVAKGLFLGEKDEISDEMYDKFKYGNVSSSVYSPKRSNSIK